MLKHNTVREKPTHTVHNHPQWNHLLENWLIDRPSLLNTRSQFNSTYINELESLDGCLWETLMLFIALQPEAQTVCVVGVFSSYSKWNTAHHHRVTPSTLSLHRDWNICWREHQSSQTLKQHNVHECMNMYPNTVLYH